MSPFSAIIFDLDDTLYPEREYAFSGYRAVAGAFASRLGPSVDWYARMCELFDGPDRGRVFNVIAAEAGAADADALAAEMIEAFRTHQPRIRLFPDAERALLRLATGCKLGVISDGCLHVQQGKIDALGLAARVEAIILTDQWGREFWKPHPRAFETMAARLGVRHDACIYVGDNRAKDFVAPNALGWRTVCVARPGGVYADAVAPAGGAASITIASLDELDA